MNYFSARDGSQIYYKDWGIETGRPVVFSHGWPLTADAFEDQMYFLASRGYRCIAHDRRGHGRSSQPWSGNDMDTYADDLAALVHQLDLNDAVLVGHSTGGGEVARYIGCYGTARVSKAVLIGAVAPLMVKTDANPGGLPIEAFDSIRAGLRADRSQFFSDLSIPFYGANRAGVNRLGRAQAIVLAARYVRRLQIALRLRQSIFRNRLHGRSQEVRHPDAHSARRRRPDRPDRCLSAPVGYPRQRRGPQGLCGSAARNVLDREGARKRRSPRVHLSMIGVKVQLCGKLSELSVETRTPFG